MSSGIRDTDLNEVITTIELLVKDVDMHYDECLAERFIGHLETETFRREIKEVEEVNTVAARQELHLSLYKNILDQFKQYMEAEQFSTINQSRLLGTFYSAMKGSIDIGEFQDVESYSELIWSSMDMVLTNCDQFSIGTYITILCAGLSKSRIAFEWLIAMKKNPPIKIVKNGQEFTIENIISLLGFVFQTTENYITKKKAAKLLSQVVSLSFELSRSTFYAHQEGILNFTRQMMLRNNPTIFMFVREIGNHGVYKSLGLYDLLEEVFTKFLATDECMINLCKCLAQTNFRIKPRTVIERLQSRNKFPEVLCYLANLRDVEGLDQLFVTYFSYPILAWCKHEETPLLAMRFLITCDERIFVERNSNPKNLKFCFVQLNILLDNEYQRCKAPVPRSSRMSLSTNFVRQCSEALTLFVVANMKVKSRQRYLSLAIGVLIKIADLCSFVMEMDIILKLLQLVQDIIENIESDPGDNRHVLQLSLKVLAATHRLASYVKPSFLYKGITECMSRTIKIALRYDDHEILNEFASMIADNPFDFQYSEESTKAYIQLAWLHMYQRSEGTTHPEYLGNICRLLLEIDLLAGDSILAHYGLRRHIEIPSILSHILREYSAVTPTIEKIICGLDNQCRKENDSSGYYDRSTYLCRLDNRLLPESVQPSLATLVQGVCLVVKSELDETHRLKAVELLLRMTETMIENSRHSFDSLMERLIDYDIVETTYDLTRDDHYSSNVYRIAIDMIDKIFTSVVRHLSPVDPATRMESLLKIRCSKIEDEHHKEMLSGKIKSITKLYLASEWPIPQKVHDPNRRPKYSDTKSMISEILKHTNEGCGALDCY